MSADYLFISCHHADDEALQQLSRALTKWGINPCSSNGTGSAALTGVMAMAVCLGPQGLDQRQKQEIGWALARQAEALEAQTGHVFPIIPILLPAADLAPAFLFRHAWVDLRHNLADPLALDRLVEATLHGTASQRPIAAIVDLCPYRGLRAFREEDAAFFFGRETFTKRLLAEVTSRNLVALVGPVGSGKSSIINAGLLPLLRRQISNLHGQTSVGSPIPRGHDVSNLQYPKGTVSQISNLKWNAVSFTPGNQPFHQLADALNKLLAPDLSKADRLIETRRLGDQLANGTARLEQLIEHALTLNGETDRLLLVVDQFEELVTLTSAPERRLFF